MNQYADVTPLLHMLHCLPLLDMIQDATHDLQSPHGIGPDYLRDHLSLIRMPALLRLRSLARQTLFQGLSNKPCHLSLYQEAG